jgi:hypothetical protein
MALIEIVDLPNLKMVIFHSFFYVYQRVNDQVQLNSTLGRSLAPPGVSAIAGAVARLGIEKVKLKKAKLISTRSSSQQCLAWIYGRLSPQNGKIWCNSVCFPTINDGISCDHL